MTVYILIFDWYDFLMGEQGRIIVGVYDTRLKAEQAKAINEEKDEKFYPQKRDFDYEYTIIEMKVQ